MLGGGEGGEAGSYTPSISFLNLISFGFSAGAGNVFGMFQIAGKKFCDNFCRIIRSLDVSRSPFTVLFDNGTRCVARWSPRCGRYRFVQSLSGSDPSVGRVLPSGGYGSFGEFLDANGLR